MLKSMTGYGRARKEISGYDVCVEIRSVNNRYLDVNVRCPRAYGFLEDKLKKLLGEYTTRGKADIFVTVDKISGSGAAVTYDRDLLESYLGVLREIQNNYSLRDDISVSSVAQYRDIFNQTKEEEDDEAVREAVLATAKEAFEDYNAMRAAEGERLCQNMLEKLDFIEQKRVEVEKLAPNAVNAYREKLTEKITELVGAANIDPARILTEAAIFADRVATDEETTRLSSHIKQFKAILSGKEPSGRKLDFLTQELNREINTIGSKANDIEISQIVVDVKSEIEKIREQIQNVE
ncbi:MAG: YicC family protein [Ruminococcaceae bacterium]|nr:YicC family protein [Oscillospiraceae bacterium]